MVFQETSKVLANSLLSICGRVSISLIVKCVVAIYGFSVLFAFLYLGYRGIYSNEDLFDSIAEINQNRCGSSINICDGILFCVRTRS